MARNNAKAGYRELGAQLRNKRLAAGLMVREMAHRTGWSSPKICRIETGEVELGLVDLVWYAGTMGIFREEAVPLIDLCRRANDDRGYWLSAHGERVPDTIGSLIYHESTADSLTVYEPLLIPGLLQTEGYARAIMRCDASLSDKQVEAGVKLRMERQRIVNSRRGVEQTFVVHEHALRTVVGGTETMYEQMIAMALAGAAPNMSVRVIRMGAGSASIFGGSFWYFGYLAHPDLVYLDSFACGTFLEDKEFVREYRELIPRVGAVALSAEESRSFVAALADEYDRGSALHGPDRVEEEQL